MSDGLPAFTCLGDSVDLWPAIPAGMSYSDKNTVGRERAAELVEVMRRTESPVLLGHVMEAIAEGAFGGVEVGFFHALSLEIIAPPRVTEFVGVNAREDDRGSFAVGTCLGHLRIVA
jgi:hypothetical protein